jgi:hypothetical protein
MDWGCDGAVVGGCKFPLLPLLSCCFVLVASREVSVYLVEGEEEESKFVTVNERSGNDPTTSSTNPTLCSQSNAPSLP